MTLATLAFRCKLRPVSLTLPASLTLPPRPRQLGSSAGMSLLAPGTQCMYVREFLLRVCSCAPRRRRRRRRRAAVVATSAAAAFVADL